MGPAMTAALFEIPRQGAPPPSGFYALPFPNDIRIDDATGKVDLSDYERSSPLVTNYIDAIQAQMHGFSLVAASFVRFSAPIDAGSLPATPRESLAADASVYLVNIDPDSEGHGQRVPLLFRFETYAGETIGRNWLSALPYPGFVLAEETTYALVVSKRLLAEDGAPVATPEEFAAVISGEDHADAAIARAQDIYAPLMAWLDAPGGDDREDVAVASVFTTQDATSLLHDVREVIWGEDAPAPAPRDIQRQDDGPNYYWFNGVYDGPNFQSGEPPFWNIEDGGNIAVDPGTGLPAIQRIEELRFSFTIPRGEMPADGWPVVIYAHGTGGSYHSFHNSGVGARLAEQGLAVLSTDQVMHGPRIPAGSSPDLLFFNFQNPLAARDNTLQGAIDLFQVVRLVLDFHHVDSGGPGDIFFDPDRIYFFGHSQGGLTGPPFLVHEPLVKGAVLSGAGGLIYLSMLLKTEPVDVASLVASVIRDYPLDEFNPVLAMLQMYIDRADPVIYGPYLARKPRPGVPAKHIFQSEGFTDRYTPMPSIEALATSIGGNLVEPVVAEIEGLELLNRLVLTAPVTGNASGVTSVLVQYEQLAGSDGHFVLFDVAEAQRQSSQFLGTLAETGAATLVAPQ